MNRVIRKSSKLDHVAYDVRGPVLDRASEMERSGIEILKLNIGNPGRFGFHVPDYLISEMTADIPDSDAYSESKGILEAREAIAGYCARKGIEGVTADDVYTGNGVSEMISMATQALLDNGDEILLPAPDYPLWTACSTLAGGHPVHYICDESNGWLPDVKDMESKITSRTKAIVIINPNNPTGAVYPKELLEDIAALARKYGLAIFADEIYDRLCMDGIEHTSIASLAPDLFCITMNGLSKSHRAAGFRVGWMTISGDKKCAKSYIEGLNMLSSMRLCSNVPAQHIIKLALADKGPDPDTQPGGRFYEQRKTIMECIDEIPGLTCVEPKAAFYCFPKLDTAKFNIKDDEKFAFDLLEKKHVLIVHGRGFHWPEPDHFRIVFLPENKVLREAMEGLKEFLSDYRQA
ncbi:MAG: pyridoxal phosphate-dependent aminotransferase [Oscillospiraceae bacterium]